MKCGKVRSPFHPLRFCQPIIEFRWVCYRTRRIVYHSMFILHCGIVQLTHLVLKGILSAELC